MTDITEEILQIPDGEDYFEIKNPHWNNSDHSNFSVELNHPEFGWIPYGVADGDSPDTYCYKIWNIRDTLNIEEYVPPEVDLDALKEQKHIELRSQRDQLRQTEFAEYKNDTFQIRQEDQDNMNTFYTHAVAMLSGVVQREIFGLMSATNSLHYFDPEEIVELAQLMKLKVQEIYQRYWYARDVLLENASTESEIQSVQIPLTIPNLQE